ncbi:MAG: hypothetical protein IJB33_00930 [Akkermansia sp.]|nr:hypothetical protein [Akkermansia sp.]
MKLHLPKMLLTAVLAACSTAYAFSPQEAVNGVMTDVDYGEAVSAGSATTLTPDGPTEYTMSTGGSYVINASTNHVKLAGVNDSDTQYNLSSVTAGSTWLAGGRFAVNASSDMSNASDIYVSGGTLQFVGTVSLSNKVIIGKSSFSPSGWGEAHNNIKNAALTIGTHGTASDGVTLSGGLEVAENAAIAMQVGYDLTIAKSLTGEGNLDIVGCKGNGAGDSVITLSADASEYEGAITLRTDGNTYPVTLKLSGDGTNLLTNAASITVGANTKLDLSAVEDATLTDKITNNGSIIISEAIINNATKSVGTLEITSLDGFTKASTGYVGATNEGNGFIQANGVRAIGESSTGDISGVTVKFGNSTFTTDNDGIVSGLTDYSTFYVNSGSEALSQTIVDAASVYRVAENGTLDIKGLKLEYDKVYLGSNATLKNSGNIANVETQRQLAQLELEADANVSAESGKMHGLVENGYGTSYLTLNGHTLTKIDDGIFFMVNTTVSGGGTIKISDGQLMIGSSGGTGKTTTATGVVFDTDTKGVLKISNTNTLKAAGVQGTGGEITGTTGTSLELDSTSNYTYGGEVKGGFNFTKKGTGTQTFTAATTLGAVTVDAGVLKFSGDTTTVGNVTINGGSVVIGKALTLNGTLTGALTIEDLAGFDSTATYTKGAIEGNGFATNLYQVLSGTTKQGVSVAYNNGSYTTDANGAIATIDYSTFFVKSGTEAVSTVKTNATSANVEMSDGTTLTMDGDMGTVSTETGATSATLTVAASGDDSAHTLTTLSAEGANVLVNGAGTLTITNATASTLTAGNAPVEGATTTAPALTLDLGNKQTSVQNLVINDGATVVTSYHGDTKDAGGFIGSSITINAGGTLKCTDNGTTKTLSPLGQKAGSVTLNGSEGKVAQLLLTNRTTISGVALNLNGYSTIGSTEGTGAVTDAKETGTAVNDQNVEEPNKGLIRERDYKAILDYNGSNKVTATGTNNNIDAALRLRSGSNTTFEVKNAGDVLSLNGNIFKANSATGTTFTKTGEGKLIINNSSVELDTMTVTGGTLQLKGAASLGNAAITMGAGTDLEAGTGTIKTLTFAAGAELTADTAVSMEGALTFQGAITLDGALLKNIQALEEGGTLDLFTGVTSLVVNGTTYSTLTEDSNVDLGVIFTLNGVAVAAETAIAGSGYYLGYSDSTVYAGKLVPEPTTATLSLLALAALAARRRRR